MLLILFKHYSDVTITLRLIHSLNQVTAVAKMPLISIPSTCHEQFTSVTYDCSKIFTQPYNLP